MRLVTQFQSAGFQLPPCIIATCILQACIIACLATPVSGEQSRRIVFLAGKPSHGYGAHEHLAGCRILADEIQRSTGGRVVCEVYGGGWPEDDSVLSDADSIVMYCDGGGGHPALPHLDRLAELISQGVGFVCLHYAVEVPKERGGAEFLDFLGGYFETHWSVNPHWTGDFQSLPDHPVTRGIEPFQAKDEWYFHMRFREGMQGVTPILSAVAPEDTMRRPDGPHSGNPHVRQAVAKGIPQHTAWVFERPDGGRSFGFTGGHFHWNWGRQEMLRLVCNAIVWTGKGEIPEEGLPVMRPQIEQLESGQDYPKPENHQTEQIKNDFKLSILEARARSRSVSTDAPAVRHPENAVSGLKVHPTLSATLSASEPVLLSPTCLDIDHRGRVWICEVVNYRGHQGKRPEGDRILILEDQDGDGVMDTSKVFYQGSDIDSAMGICVLGNQVIVSASPNIWIFTDETGDDRPDRKELLFSNTGKAQHDHSAHSFVFGPDGRLVWNFGNTGEAVHDPKGGPIVDTAGNRVVDNGRPYYGGMVFRCNPDGSGFETLAHNFRNNYEVTVDSFGTLWQSDNDDDGNKATRINYVMEYGNYGYRDELTGAGWRVPRVNMEDTIPEQHWHLNDPGVVPTMLITGAGSPSGIVFYEGELLPEPFQNQLIHCEPGKGVVRAYITEPSGAGYSASILNVMQADEDDWFRPADVCVAPDGSLFIADWYDPGVGGHQMGDLDRGRLYRLAPEGMNYRIPPLDLSTPRGASAALLSPNQSTRYLAWQALMKFGESARLSLEQLSTDERSWVRARALWAMGTIDNLNSADDSNSAADLKIAAVAQGLSDPEPKVRCMAIRLARKLRMEPADYFIKVLNDSSAAVRRELAIALHLDKSAEMPRLWAALAAGYDGNDRWLLEALGIGAHHRWDECFSAYEKRIQATNQAPHPDIVWRARTSSALPMIEKILTAPDLNQAQARRMMRALEYHDDQERAAIMLNVVDHLTGHDQLPAVGNFLLSELLLRLPEGKRLSQATKIQTWMQAILLTEPSRQRKLDLVSNLEVPNPAQWLLPLVIDADLDPVSVQAAEMLLKSVSPAVWKEHLSAQDSLGPSRLVEAFASASPDLSMPQLIEILSSPEIAGPIRAAAAKGLTRSAAGAEQLFRLAASDELPRECLVVVGSMLRSSQDPEVRSKALQLFPAPKMKSQQTLPEVAELMTMRGDPRRGAHVYQVTGTCAKCHPLVSNLRSIGPDLSEIGAKLAREALFVSILDPSAGISHSYEAFSALTDAGTVITGLRISQTDTEVILRDAEGIDHTLRLEELEDFRQLEQSLMPENLTELMTAQELVDLVEYLQSLRGNST
jgi:putative membrane-bound dehydrogenase-like protein